MKKVFFLITLILFLVATAVVYGDTYTCSDITSGIPTSSQTQICNSGTLQNGSAGELCPYLQTQCNRKEISGTPKCPSGYTLQNGECVSNIAPSCPGGYTFSNGECVEKTSPSCPSGYTETNGQCQQGNVGGSVWNIWGQELLYTSGNCIDGDGFWVGNICFNTSNNTFGGTIAYDSDWLYANMYSGSGSGITGDGGYWGIGGYISYNSSNNTFSGVISGGGTTITGNGNCLDFSGYGVSGSNQVCMSLHTTAMSCPSGYALQNGECVGTASPYCSQAGYSLTNADNTCTSTITPTYTCPSGTELVGDQCVSPWTCPVSGNGGDSATCIEASGSSTYYCSPYSCYTNTSGTSVSATPVNAAMPSPQTNNGTVTDSGCEGSVYLFPGTAMQCRSGGEQTAWQDCCNASTYLFGMLKCTTQEESVAKDLQYDTQYGANGYNNPNSYGGSGDAQYVGSYCSDKFLGLCLENMKVYCVFHSLLGLIIQEQGRAQLGIGFGSPQNPDCSGLTPTQFQELNFSNFDFTEYVTVLENKIKAGVINTNTLNQMQNYTTTITNQVSNYENELSGVNP